MASEEQQWGAQLQRHCCTNLAALWRQQQLCDVALRAAGGETLGAHRIVLASASGFFRALCCGAGQSMREGSSSSGSGSNPAAPQQQLVVDLPYPACQLSVLLGMLYEHDLQVCSSNVAWLLDLACYLEIGPLQDACCGFLRGALSPDCCVDVLLLAHHYDCSGLQAEAVQYLGPRLGAMLLMPEQRGALTRLPASVLQQLLACEALEVEQESELLCLVADWVLAGRQQQAANSQEDRASQLPGLLALLQLSALGDTPLTPQQLRACTCGEAAALAQQLYLAAVQCSSTRDGAAQQQQQQHLAPAGPGAGSAAAAKDEPCLATMSSSSSGSVADCWWQPPPPQQQQQQQHWDSSSRDAAGPAWLVSRDINNHTAPCASTSSSAADDAANAIVHWPSSSGNSSSSIGAVMLGAWPGRQRGYQPTRLLVAGGHDLSWRGLKAVELYDPLTDSWQPGPALPAALPFAGAGLVGRGELYVVGGGMYSTLLVRLEPGCEAWTSCEGPRTPRLHAAVTASAGLLYVAGGRSQVNQVVPAVEVYCPATASWASLPDMQRPRYAHALAALGGCVYSVGGQATKSIHRSVERFNPERGCWELLPSLMASERKYCAAAALGGRLLVLGGLNEGRRRLASLEAYDPREGRWAGLASMQHARSSCGVAALGGRLYAAGGNASDQQLHAAVEEYDAAAGRWRPCAPLACGRSGLLAAAV